MRSIAVFLAALTLAACGGSSQKLEKLSAGVVVLAFGDSLTFGTGASPGESYPAQLEALIGRRVVNAGVPGEASEEGLERLPGVLDDVKPAMLLLCHGGNDFLRKMDDGRAAQNVRAMVRLARDRNIQVVLIATPKPTLPPSVPAFYREIASEARVGFVDAVMKEVLSDRDLKSDLVHPNAKGYREIAKAVEKALKQGGAI
ncbi:MAG TPA: GDSL-type esterase/lipase family protein [Usitatibacter sp.]|nr:GDSL-type esterase/lipase family protein [Usitatibacter sp.]